MNLKWRQMIPTTITLLAMLAGFVSILLTIEGMRLQNSGAYYSKAALLIMLAMILDGLDGNLARWLKGLSEFGSELDTYVDLTAFGIAPAILVFAVTREGSLFRVFLPSAVALSGVVRLARFKAHDPLRGQAGYAGLPITANAAWVSLFVFITLTPPKDKFTLNEGPVAALFLAGILLFIFLQVTSLRYPKPTKKVFLFVPCVLLVILLAVLYLFHHQRLAAGLAFFMILMWAAYVIFGPLFIKSIAFHRARVESKRNSELEGDNGVNSCGSE